MKATLLLLLCLTQFNFSQEVRQAYKFAEFENLGLGDDSTMRYEGFLLALREERAKGIVAIFTGKTKDRFGNLLGYVNGARTEVELFRGFPKERLEIVILEGKEFFSQEFWVIPEGAKSPFENTFKFDWTGLKGRYHFSRACLECDSDHPGFTSVQPALSEYTEILRQYSDYRGEVVVNNFAELSQMRRLLDETKLPRSRYSIKIRKPKATDGGLIAVDLYLIAKATK